MSSVVHGCDIIFTDFSTMIMLRLLAIDINLSPVTYYCFVYNNFHVSMFFQKINIEKNVEQSLPLDKVKMQVIKSMHVTP